MGRVRCVCSLLHAGCHAIHKLSCLPGTLSTEIARSTYGYDDFKVVRSTELLPAGTIPR